jgi:hypothetical protein
MLHSAEEWRLLSIGKDRAIKLPPTTEHQDPQPPGLAQLTRCNCFFPPIELLPDMQQLTTSWKACVKTLLVNSLPTSVKCLIPVLHAVPCSNGGSATLQKAVAQRSASVFQLRYSKVTVSAEFFNLMLKVFPEKKKKI